MRWSRTGAVSSVKAKGGVVVGKGDLAVEEGGVGGVVEVVGGGEEGPDGDVAVAVRRLDVLERRVHVPLGPVAAAVVLVGEDVGEEVGGGVGLAAGEQPLERPLAGVADAPGRARVLLEPVGRGEVDRGVVLEPGEGVGQGGDRAEGGGGRGSVISDFGMSILDWERGREQGCRCPRRDCR